MELETKGRGRFFAEKAGKEVSGSGAWNRLGAAGFVLLGLYLITGLALREDFVRALKTAAVEIGCTFLPGLAFSVLLMPRRKQSLPGWLALSFAFGYGINIGSYFLLSAFHGLGFAGIWSILLLTGSAAVLVWKRREIRITVPSAGNIPVLGLLAAALVCGFLIYAGRYLHPAVKGAGYYNQDLLWWLENACALKIGFPPTDLRFSIGQTFYYHYFSSVQLAWLSLAGGLDIFSLGVSYYWVGKTVLLFGSAYLLFEEYGKKWQFIGVLTVLFCSGLEKTSVITYFSHVWSAPFGFDLGLSCGMLFLWLFLKQDDTAFSPRRCVCTLLLFALCVGSKAPVALILMAVPGLVCLKWVFRRELRKGLIYGFGILILFAGIMVGCVGMLRSGQGTDAVIGFQGLSRLLNVSVLANPVLFFLVCVSVVLNLCVRKQWDMGRFALFLSWLAGTLLGAVIRHDGSSEMYYVMAGFVPGLLYSVRTLSACLPELRSAALKYAILIPFCALLAAGCGLMMLGAYGGAGVLRYAAEGFRNLTSKEIIPVSDSYYGLSEEEAEALAWIREHTPEDAVILSDKAFRTGSEKYMCCGVFSERQAYYECPGYFGERYAEERARREKIMEGVFAGDSEALGLAKADGADYILLNREVDPENIPEEGTEPVYEAGPIRIYRIV